MNMGRLGAFLILLISSKWAMAENIPPLHPAVLDSVHQSCQSASLTTKNPAAAMGRCQTLASADFSYVDKLRVDPRMTRYLWVGCHEATGMGVSSNALPSFRHCLAVMLPRCDSGPAGQPLDQRSCLKAIYSMAWRFQKEEATPPPRPRPASTPQPEGDADVITRFKTMR